MSLKRRESATLILAALITATTVAIRAEDPEISRRSIDGGGVMRSTGGSLELSGTIGQPDAGLMIGGSLTLSGGFWFPLAPGDCNNDGGIDLFDHVDGAPCLGGPGAAVRAECACFDLDADRDVDLWDAAEFQAAFTGH